MKLILLNSAEIVQLENKILQTTISFNYMYFE